MSSQQHILVIKLSALGDFIQALGPMAAIRKHHPDAKITLLTTKGFKGFAQDCGYFDDVWIDDRPSWLDLTGWLAFRAKLNSEGFTRVYDLQNNDRSRFYYQLFKSPKPEWVGTVKAGSHYNGSPDRTAGHAFDGHVQTLGLAGITDIQVDKLTWMQGDLSAFDLKRPYALLVPGCAPQHPHKRWPARAYAQLANILAENNIQPVLIGTKDDKEATDLIADKCPQALDLNSATNLAQIAALGRNAKLAVGNDTGPMHLIAATGIPCISLFSGRTNPIKHAPKGDQVSVLQENDLNALKLERVCAALDSCL